MSTTVQPPAAAPKHMNRLGYTIADYRGADSTLCAGCGHDAITSQIIKAFYEYGVEPYRVAKLSGIGCSSKTPAYFLNMSHGLNGDDFLQRNDAYHFFQATGDLFITGLTQTNVMDVRVILVSK